MKNAGSFISIGAMIGATFILLGGSNAVNADPHIFLPRVENPVLAPQPNQWDGSGVLQPKAIAARGRFYLFYTGYLSTGPHSIGFARTFEPAGTLSRAFCNPVLTGDGTGFDSKSVSFPTVTVQELNAACFSWLFGQVQ